MTNEYQRVEFWSKPTKKEDICILEKDIYKLSKEELKYLNIKKDSLSEIIKTKEQADEFMNQLNFAIKQGKDLHNK